MPALLEAEHAQCATSQVAVPYGRCAEPSNVAAGGGACPIRSRECTDRILITGRRHLHRTLSEYADQYTHRPTTPSARNHPTAGPTPRLPTTTSAFGHAIGLAASSTSIRRRREVKAFFGTPQAPGPAPIPARPVIAGFPAAGRLESPWAAPLTVSSPATSTVPSAAGQMRCAVRTILGSRSVPGKQPVAGGRRA
jgi:hypothetical protein